MNETVLITGASSGIGYEFANIFGSKGYTLFLTALDEPKFSQAVFDFKSKGYAVYSFASDLSTKESPPEIYKRSVELGLRIDVLVNNAGFGDYGNFHESNWAKQNAMMHVNMISLTHLTHLYLPDMVSAGKGKILNVASVASFMPGPLMSVYYATKAYVLSFSMALNQEVKDKGIVVTALCPGQTETNFQEVVSQAYDDLVDESKIPTAKEVAQFGYESLMAGESLAIHGETNRQRLDLQKDKSLEEIAREVYLKHLPKNS